MSKTVELYEWKCTGSGDTYYGYPPAEAMTKTIDNELYIEVTPSLTKPKVMWMKQDSLTFYKKVDFNVPG